MKKLVGLFLGSVFLFWQGSAFAQTLEDVLKNQISSHPQSKILSCTRLKLNCEKIDRLGNPDEVKNLLKKFKKLQILDLCVINLKELPAGIFSGLGNLQELWINLKELPAGIFSGLGNLQELYLYGNELTALSENIFSGLKNLQILDLSNNKLTTLSENIFSGLGNLQELYLYGNELTALSEKIFSGLTNLQKLYLHSNNLTELHPGIFSGLENLQHLNLSWNQSLTCLPASFRNLTNLTLLQMNGCTSLVPHGQGDTLGYEELRRLLRDRFVYDVYENQQKLPEKTLESVLEAHAQKPLQWVLENGLGTLVPTECPETSMTQEEALARFSDLKPLQESIRALIEKDEGKSEKGRDFWPGVFDKIASIWAGGYVNGPWVSQDKNTLAQQRNLIAFVLKAIGNEANVDQKSMLLLQFVKGMIHCPEGQQGALETLYAALSPGLANFPLQSKNADDQNVETFFFLRLSELKNKLFDGIVTPNSDQNVHVRAHYYANEALQKLLGVRGIEATNIGTTGQDYLNGPGNALDIFLTKFTPEWVAQRLADWVNEDVRAIRVNWLWLKLDRDPYVSEEKLRKVFEKESQKLFETKTDAYDILLQLGWDQYVSEENLRKVLEGESQKLFETERDAYDTLLQLGWYPYVSEENLRKVFEKESQQLFKTERDAYDILLPLKVKPEGILAYLKKRGFLKEASSPALQP